MRCSKFPENGRLSGASERIAAEGRRYSAIAPFLVFFFISYIFVRFCRPGKSTHIAAEGRQCLNLTEPCLLAATGKRDRFFVKMSVSRTREGRFRFRAEATFFQLGGGPFSFFCDGAQARAPKMGVGRRRKRTNFGGAFCPDERFA